MRNLLFAGTAGLLLVVGAAGAANANNPNVPTWSPLSINTNLGQTMVRHRAHRMTEGRAAYVKPMPQTDIFSDGSSDGNHNYPLDGNIGQSNVPGGQPFGAPENMGDR